VHTGSVTIECWSTLVIRHKAAWKEWLLIWIIYLSCVFSVLSEHSSGGVGGSGGGGGGGSSDYSAMFSTPPPQKVSPPGPGDLDNISCGSSSLLGASGGTGGGHRYPTGPEPTNTATSVYNTTPSKYVVSKDHCQGRLPASHCTQPRVLTSVTKRRCFVLCEFFTFHKT
jgi:hypothetical protein